MLKNKVCFKICFFNITSYGDYLCALNILVLEYFILTLLMSIFSMYKIQREKYFNQFLKIS